MSSEENKATADKILHAATILFAAKSIDAVSVKTIANLAEVNSALISYHFGGKTKLYQQVLSHQTDAWLETIERIDQDKLSPLLKIEKFMDTETEIQLHNANYIHIIYREMLSPTPEGEQIVNKKLFRIHDFLTQFIADAIKDGSLHGGLDAPSIAFALESIMAFFFMAKDQLQYANRLPSIGAREHLRNIYMNYLNSLKTTTNQTNTKAAD